MRQKKKKNAPFFSVNFNRDEFLKRMDHIALHTNAGFKGCLARNLSTLSSDGLVKYLNKNSISLINEIYRKDFEMFGYEMI